MRYTICTDDERTRRPVLLFETVAVDQIAKDPAIHAFFPYGYFVKAISDHEHRRYRFYYDPPPGPPKPPKRTIVTTVLGTEDPDKAALDLPSVLFYIKGVRYEINLRRRYNQCLSFFKAVGCASCPDKGTRCISEAAGVDIPDSVKTAFESQELSERLIQNKTVIAGHTFVDPGKTKTEPFDAALRPYWKHDFDDIEEREKARSLYAQRGADTKKFKKTQCVKCPIKDSCDRSKWCKGAYPPVEDIIEMSNRRLTEELKKSLWDEWKLWEIARAMGEHAKHSRWNIVLTGLTIRGADGIHPTVHRAKGSITEYGKLKTYEDIAKVFKLAATEAEALEQKRGPVLDPTLRALLWLTLKTGRGHQSYGWGCRRYTTGVGCDDSKVSVLWTNGSYLSRGSSELTEIKHVASQLSDGYLGDVDKIEVR